MAATKMKKLLSLTLIVLIIVFYGCDGMYPKEKQRVLHQAELIALPEFYRALTGRDSVQMIYFMGKWEVNFCHPNKFEREKYNSVHSNDYWISIGVDTIDMNGNPINKKVTSFFVLNSMLVCQSHVFGYLPEGSVLFDMTKAVQGFQVQVKNDGAIISTSYCTKDDIDRHLKLIRYKLSVRDSIIPLK